MEIRPVHSGIVFDAFFLFLSERRRRFAPLVRFRYRHDKNKERVRWLEPLVFFFVVFFVRV
jgi:hypothetical protein